MSHVIFFIKHGNNYAVIFYLLNTETKTSSNIMAKRANIILSQNVVSAWLVFGLFFFFFPSFCWQPVEVEQWWRSNGGGERERERESHTFLGLKIGLECNK